MRNKTKACITVLGNAIEYALSTGPYEPLIAVTDPPTCGVDSDNEDFDEDPLDALDEMPGKPKRKFEVFHDGEFSGNSIITEEDGPSL